MLKNDQNNLQEKQHNAQENIERNHQEGDLSKLRRVFELRSDSQDHLEKKPFVFNSTSVYISIASISNGSILIIS